MIFLQAINRLLRNISPNQLWKIGQGIYKHMIYISSKKPEAHEMDKRVRMIIRRSIQGIETSSFDFLLIVNLNKIKMPAVTMNVDYTRRKQKSANIFDSIRTKKQLSMSPKRFRFTRYDHVKLGVIHPESTGLSEKIIIKPEYKNYGPGDQFYMEVTGRKCPTTNIQPDVIYTGKDRPSLAQHLVQPFFYIQQLFPKGRPVSEVSLNHPDVFIDFTTLHESKRNNKNLYNTDYIKILKAMTKEERSSFYTRSSRVNQEYALIFKRFVKALIKQGLFSKPYKLETIFPRIPQSQIEEIAEQNHLIKRLTKKLSIPIIRKVQIKKTKLFKIQKEYDKLLINKQSMTKLFELLGYQQEYLTSDIEILFKNVIQGDSPIGALQHITEPIHQTISLNSFLYNAQEFLKLKYKIKNIFSHNAAKSRNVYIKYSLYLYLGEGWRVFKLCLKELHQCEIYQYEPYQQMIKQRDELINLKRIYAKHLQHTPLDYILLRLDPVKDIYVDTINYNAERINKFLSFQEVLFHDRHSISLEDAVDIMIYMQIDKSESDQLISLLQKILKYNDHKVQNLSKSKYVTIPQVSSYVQISQKQVLDYLDIYTKKQENEWNQFRNFLNEFNIFVEEKLNIGADRLQNVRKQWECNMIAEWLMKKMKKLDNTIEIYLAQSMEILNQIHKLDGKISNADIDKILQSEMRMTVNAFLNEDNQMFIKQLLSIREPEIVKKPWDFEIQQAIQNYNQISSQLQQALIDNKQPIIPQQTNQQTVKQLLDENSPKHVSEVVQVKKTSEKIKSPKTSPKQKETKKVEIKPSETPKVSVKENKSTPQTNRSLTESELDAKIRHAQMLQNKFFQNIDRQSQSTYLTSKY